MERNCVPPSGCIALRICRIASRLHKPCHTFPSLLCELPPHTCFRHRVCDLEASLAAKDEALRAVRRERSVLLSEIRRLGGTRPAAELLVGGGGTTPPPNEGCAEGRRRGALPVMEGMEVVQPGSRGRGQRQSLVPRDGASGRWGEGPEDDGSSGGEDVQQLQHSHAVQLQSHAVLSVWPPRQVVAEEEGSPSPSSASTSSSSSSIWEAATRNAAGKDDGP